jgi:hypothetical protein
MSKWYEVEVQVLIVCAVEVKDDEGERDAIDKALYSCWVGRGRTVGTTVGPLPAEHLETIKKNAHRVFALEDEEDDDDDDNL